jgi:DNA-binding transcriptional ArsR family regulator
VLESVAARGTWDERDRKALRTAYRHHKEDRPSLSLEDLAHILDWWSDLEASGERYLQALRVYQEVFFAEEERRILPALQDALLRAQDLAQRLALPDLLEELSQGVRFDEPPQVPEVVLAPSYWATPLVTFEKVSKGREMWLFGARPPDASLVPGELVPDAMVRTLKALSESTRLRILRYLAAEPLAPAELARRLRLRVPTVTHHLKTLRLAGLVQLTIGMGAGKPTKYYAARPGAVEATFSSLKSFLAEGDSEEQS